MVKLVAWQFETPQRAVAAVQSDLQWPTAYKKHAQTEESALPKHDW